MKVNFPHWELMRGIFLIFFKKARQFITFGVLNGFIRRIHEYPISFKFVNASLMSSKHKGEIQELSSSEVNYSNGPHSDFPTSEKDIHEFGIAPQKQHSNSNFRRNSLDSPLSIHSTSGSPSTKTTLHSYLHK